VDAAHKQLKSYLPGELCEAFRAAGMTHDLYDWQVCHHPWEAGMTHDLYDWQVCHHPWEVDYNLIESWLHVLLVEKYMSPPLKTTFTDLPFLVLNTMLLCGKNRLLW